MKQNTSPSNNSNQNGQNGEDYPSDKSTSDSLLTLVQPELKSLNKYWLAALRDHALLALPDDFASQLPPDGGAFYNPEATSTTRPHYLKAWAPIVYAVALWLNGGGLQVIEGNQDGSYCSPANGGPMLPGMAVIPVTNPSLNKKPEEIKGDYFHLIMGKMKLFHLATQMTRQIVWLPVLLELREELL